MRLGTWNSEGSIQKLRRILLVLSAGWVVAAGWLGISAYMLSTAAKDYHESAKGHQASLSELQQMIRRANSEKSIVPATGFGAVSTFQASVEAAAAGRGCNVTEFQAGAEIMPYLTRFSKDTPKNDWGQVEVQFTVRGKLVDVMNTVGTFSQQPVPFEFNSLEIDRQDVDKAGVVTVSAKVSLRVLTRYQGDIKA